MVPKFRFHEDDLRKFIVIFQIFNVQRTVSIMKKIIILIFLTSTYLFGQKSVSISEDKIDVHSSTAQRSINSRNTYQFGNAGYFENDNGAGFTTALYGLHNGYGAAIGGTNSGNGPGGLFLQTNASSVASALVSRNQGIGRAGSFEITLNSNTSPALYASSAGTGYAIHGVNTGQGIGGFFQNSSPSNTSSSLVVDHKGAMEAVTFSIDNLTNSNTVIKASTNGTGSVASFSNASSNATFKVAQNGSGYGSIFTNTLNTNTNPVISALTFGSGSAISANSYAGTAGLFSSTTGYAIITDGGNVGYGNSTPNAPLQFSNSLTNRKVVIYETGNNEHQFCGIGINSGIFRYSSRWHRFFARLLCCK